MTPTSQRHAHALAQPTTPATQETTEGRRSMRAMVMRAGLAALALSVAVSGGAYAAVRVGEHGRTSGAGTADQRIDALGAEGARSGVSITPSASTVTTETVDTTDPHGSLQQESGDLPRGETKVATPGVDGLVRITYEVTTVDGKEVSRKPLAQVVVTQKVDEVVLVGTGAAKKQEQSQSQAPAASSDSTGGSSGSGGSASAGGSGSSGGSASAGDSGGSGGSASAGGSEDSSSDAGSGVGDDVWVRLAQCESGGDPTINTGNGFYGLYQFTLSTWQSLGGTGYPNEADAATQTAMAKKLQAQAGWGQWPGCSDKLGLR